MKKITAVILFFAVTFSLGSKVYAFGGGHELGLGYGAQFRNNKDIYQIEFFYRPALPFFQENLMGWHFGSRVELAAAYFTLQDNNDFETMRFSVMPQLYAKNWNILLFAGFGGGFMFGDVEYPRHHLGGKFLLNSKLGAELLVNEYISLETSFYHQSNAGIYDHNASLNMMVGNIVFHF